MTYEDIVNKYILEKRPEAREDMREFKNERSPSAAIRRAALCKTREGKRYKHQWRIPGELLEEAETKLQAIRGKISKAPDFAALHQSIKEEIGCTKGIGALTVYDIAHRIGAYFNMPPNRVYLHAGTRVGARAFGICGDSFDPKDPKILPKPFSLLTPSEIEDCLCSYRNELRDRTLNRNGTGCGVRGRKGCC